MAAGRCELLSHQALDEAAASDFPARLQTTKRAKHVSPLDRQTLSGRQFPRHNTVALEQDLSDTLGQIVGLKRVGGTVDRRRQRGPAAGRSLADEDPAASVAGAT